MGVKRSQKSASWRRPAKKRAKEVKPDLENPPSIFKKRVGQPSLKEGYLRTQRDAWISLLEPAWYEIGWRLEGALEIEGMAGIVVRHVQFEGEPRTNRMVLLAKSLVRCRSMMIRVSGLAARKRCSVSTCHDMARTDSIATASTSAGTPLRSRAEPTKSPAANSPRTRSPFATRTLPRMISEMAAMPSPLLISGCPASRVVQYPISRICSSFLVGISLRNR